MSESSVRLLSLLSLLQNPREWNGAELAERLEVSRRTIRRDIERLRAMGYPVEGDRGSTGGYRLRAGRAMPPLLLEDEEAVAIALGLRTVASGPIAGMGEPSARALAKIEQVLPDRLRRTVGLLQSATVPMTVDGPAADPDTLALLAAASIGTERVRFAYRSRTGKESRRLVEPYRLVSTGRLWYLVAYDLNRSDWRSFRVDRMRSPEPTGVRAAPRELPAEDVAGFVAESRAAVVARYRTTVTVYAPVETVAERLPAGEGVLERIDDQHCRLHTGSDYVEWLAVRIAGLGADFEVHEPPELVAYLRELSGRMARAVEDHPIPT